MRSRSEMAIRIDSKNWRCTRLYLCVKLRAVSLAVFQILGNLPVERAKDAVCFLQWCGVSLVSSYGVWFLQRGGVSLASSAIIYNIVKVKVTCWPVDLFDPLTRRPVEPFDPLTRRPVNLFEKEPFKAIARSTYIHCWDVTRLTCWPVDPLTHHPVDLLEKEPLNSNCEVHLHTALRCNAGKGAELDSAAWPQQSRRGRCSVWSEAGAYII